MNAARAVPLIVACCLALAAQAAFADPKRQRGPDHRRPVAPPPSHRPVRPAPPPPHGAPPPADWDHGRWHHGWRGDRVGWWWIVGYHWYFVDPWYPYWQPWPPREVIVIDRDRAEPEAVPSGPPPPAYWYRCDDPSGYYPYVNECAGGWKAVPAVPPGMDAQKAAPQ